MSGTGLPSHKTPSVKGVYRMKVSRLTLIVLAAFVWYAGGIALLLKGSALIKSAYVIDCPITLDLGCPTFGYHCGTPQGEVPFQ